MERQYEQNLRYLGQTVGEAPPVAAGAGSTDFGQER